MSIETFSEHVRGIKLGTDEFDAFLKATESKEALRAYAHGAGSDLTSEEEDEILAMRSAIFAAGWQQGNEISLSDAALDGVAGGLNISAIGALVGGGLGAIGGLVATTVAAPIAVGLAVGAIIVGGTTGVGAAIGTGVGAIVDALK